MVFTPLPSRISNKFKGTFNEDFYYLAQLFVIVEQSNKLAIEQLNQYIQDFKQSQTHLQSIDSSALMNAQHQLQTCCLMLSRYNFKALHAFLEMALQILNYNLESKQLLGLSDVIRSLHALNEFLEECSATNHYQPIRLFYFYRKLYVHIKPFCQNISYYSALNIEFIDYNHAIWQQHLQRKARKISTLNQVQKSYDVNQFANPNQIYYAVYEQPLIEKIYQVFLEFKQQIYASNFETMQQLQQLAKQLNWQALIKLSTYCQANNHTQPIVIAMMMLLIESVLQKPWRIHLCDYIYMDDFFADILQYLLKNSSAQTINQHIKHMYALLQEDQLKFKLKQLLIEQLCTLNTVQEENNQAFNLNLALSLQHLTALKQLLHLLLFENYTHLTQAIEDFLNYCQNQDIHQSIDLHYYQQNLNKKIQALSNYLKFAYFGYLDYFANDEMVEYTIGTVNISASLSHLQSLHHPNLNQQKQITSNGVVLSSALVLAPNPQQQFIAHKGWQVLWQIEKNLHALDTQITEIAQLEHFKNFKLALTQLKQVMQQLRISAKVLNLYPQNQYFEQALHIINSYLNILLKTNTLDNFEFENCQQAIQTIMQGLHAMHLQNPFNNIALQAIAANLNEQTRIKVNAAKAQQVNQTNQTNILITYLNNINIALTEHLNNFLKSVDLAARQKNVDALQCTIESLKNFQQTHVEAIENTHHTNKNLNYLNQYAIHVLTQLQLIVQNSLSYTKPVAFNAALPSLAQNLLQELQQAYLNYLNNLNTIHQVVQSNLTILTENKQEETTPNPLVHMQNEADLNNYIEQSILLKALSYANDVIEINVDIDKNTQKIESQQNKNQASLKSTTNVEALLLETFLDEAKQLHQEINHLFKQYTSNQYFANHAKQTEAKKVILRHLHTLKGAARTTGLQEIGQLYHDLEDMAANQAIWSMEHNIQAVYFQVEKSVALSPLPYDLMDDNLRQQDWSIKLNISDLEKHIEQIGILQHHLQKNLSYIKAMLGNLDNKRASHRRVTQLLGFLEKKHVQQSNTTQSVPTVNQTFAQLQDKHNMDSLEFDSYTDADIYLNELRNLMSSLNDDDQSELEQMNYLAHETDDLYQQMLELQNTLYEISLLNIASIQNRLQLIATQTAEQEQKDIRLFFDIDPDIKVVKSILDSLSFIAEHLIRNAITHGIEAPAQRKFKTSYGSIFIEIKQKGEHLAIYFEDDGAGIDVQKIRQKAINMDWLSDSEEITLEQMLDFIIQPGFSTAEQLSLNAGRGIGLDSVVAHIKQLGGDIKLSSPIDKGLVVKIQIPLISFTSQMLIARVAEYTFGIPLGYIESVQLYQHGLQRCTHMADMMQTKHPNPQHVIQIQYLQQRHYLSLDIIAYETLFIHNTPLFMHPKGLIGMSLNQENSIPIYNPMILLQDHEQQKRQSKIQHMLNHSHKQSIQSKDNSKPHLMIVDDSATIRLSLQKALSKDYQLSFAIDGKEALDKLERLNDGIQLFLLDIEMPRMDGFELTQHLRASQQYKNTPIIILSSRQGEKYQDQAYQLGANDYLGKPYQLQQLLSRVVRELTLAKHQKRFN